MPKFLVYLESVLAYNARKHSEGYSIGESLSYVDVALWHTLEAAASQFPNSYAEIESKIPLLVDFRKKIA